MDIYKEIQLLQEELDNMLPDILREFKCFFDADYVARYSKALHHHVRTLELYGDEGVKPPNEEQKLFKGITLKIVFFDNMVITREGQTIGSQSYILRIGSFGGRIGNELHVSDGIASKMIWDYIKPKLDLSKYPNFDCPEFNQGLEIYK